MLYRHATLPRDTAAAVYACRCFRMICQAARLRVTQPESVMAHDYFGDMRRHTAVYHFQMRFAAAAGCADAFAAFDAFERHHEVAGPRVSADFITWIFRFLLACFDAH